MSSARPASTRLGRALALAALLLLASGLPAMARARAAPPVDGPGVAEMAAVDEAMLALMARWQLPGGQLAVGKDGRLVFSRGYGLADVQAAEPVRSSSRFRIASVSKPITGVAILKLVEEGRLSLDDRAFRLLEHLRPAAGATVDPRLDDITVRDLLQHAGGWDSGKSFDPQYLPWSRMASATVGAPDPPTCQTIIRFMLGVRLDFDPGTRTAYSNFGYCVLGRVIERVTGLSYERYVQTHVLEPAGASGMQLGRTRLEERAPGEVRYYGPPGQAPRPSVFPGVGYAPVAYGDFYLEALDAHGGWISTAEALVRFMSAVDGQRGPALLRPETVRAMLETPLPSAEGGGAGAGNAASASGLAWNVRAVPGGHEWSHAGALEGSTAAWMGRTPDGVALAFVFNSLPEDFGAFFGEAIPALTGAVGRTETWPAHDLVGDAPPPAPPAVRRLVPIRLR
jgi:N-acyl-D-amino-acid deacylase